jgi:hypothetical protein
MAAAGSSRRSFARFSGGGMIENTTSRRPYAARSRKIRISAI